MQRRHSKRLARGAAAATGALAAALTGAAIWMNGGGPDTPPRSAGQNPDPPRSARAPVADGQPAPAARPPRSAGQRSRHRATALDPPAPTLPAGADEHRLEPRLRQVAFDAPQRDPGVIDAATIFPRHGVGSWGALYADCNRATGYEVLDQLDLIQFMLHYEHGHPYADCDRSGAIDYLDLLCFMESFASGR